MCRGLGLVSRRGPRSGPGEGRERHRRTVTRRGPATGSRARTASLGPRVRMAELGGRTWTAGQVREHADALTEMGQAQLLHDSEAAKRAAYADYFEAGGVSSGSLPCKTEPCECPELEDSPTLGPGRAMGRPWRPFGRARGDREACLAGAPDEGRAVGPSGGLHRTARACSRHGGGKHARRRVRGRRCGVGQHPGPSHSMSAPRRSPALHRAERETCIPRPLAFTVRGRRGLFEALAWPGARCCAGLPDAPHSSI